MKKLLVAIAVVIVLLIAGVVALPFLVPTDTVIARVQERVRAETGRELTVGGPVEISVLPDLAVRLENVALANAPGGEAETLASLGALEVSVAVMPLLSGTVAIDRFRMVAPVINLEVAEDGTPNWRLGGPAADDGAGPGEDAAGPGEGAGGGVPSEVSLGVVEIVEGRVTYSDAAAGETIVIEDVEARLRLSSLDNPAELEAGFVYGGEAVAVTARVEEPRGLIGGDGSAATLDVASDPVTLTFDGRIVPGGPDGGSIAGATTLEVPSVPALSAWLPMALPETPVETVAFDGGIDAAPARVALTEFTLTADGSTATGTLAVDLNGDRPAVSGDLALSALDLDALLAEPEATAAPEDGAETVAVPETSAPVPGTIDLALLDAATVDLSVDLGGLTIEGTEIGPTTLDITLADRRLDVQIAEAAVFDGTVAGSILVDGSAEIPQLDVSVAVREIALGPPLAAFGGMDDAAGVLTLDLQATGRGATRQALADSLSGSAAARLGGGAFTVPNPEDGRPLRLEGVDLTLDMPSFDGPLSAIGSATLSGEAVAFDLTAGDPRALVAGGESALAVDLDAPRVRLVFDGTASGGPTPAISGTLDTAVPSLAALAAWLPVTLPVDGLPVDSVSAQGTLAASPVRVALADATVSADDLSATGTVAVELAGARPSIHARLSTGYLDLDSLLGVAGDGGRPAGGPGDGPGDGAADSAGTAAGDGWSNETIDLSPLTAVDVDAVVELREGARAGGVDIGSTTLTVLLQDGALDASAPSVPVFGGTVTADVGVTAGQTPAWNVALQVDGVQIEPVLMRFADSDRLSGATDATLNATAAGPSPAAIVSTLNGAGALVFRDGAIKGINIAAMVRNIGTAFNASNTGEAQSTDFAEMGGGFTLTEGLFRTDDLRMLAPLFRIEGRGTSSIPQRTLDFRLEPKVVGTIEGQGGQFEETGVRVPILVGGTWSDPTFRPDLAGLIQGTLEDPEAARQQVEGLIQGLQGGDGGIQPDDMLRGLLGGGGQAASEPAAPAEPEAAPADPTAADPTAADPTAAEPAPADQPAAEPEPAPRNLEEQLQEDPIGTLRGLFGN